MHVAISGCEHLNDICSFHCIPSRINETLYSLCAVDFVVQEIFILGLGNRIRRDMSQTRSDSEINAVDFIQIGYLQIPCVRPIPANHLLQSVYADICSERIVYNAASALTVIFDERISQSFPTVVEKTIVKERTVIAVIGTSCVCAITCRIPSYAVMIGSVTIRSNCS